MASTYGDQTGVQWGHCSPYGPDGPDGPDCEHSILMLISRYNILLAQKKSFTLVLRQVVMLVLGRKVHATRKLTKMFFV